MALSPPNQHASNHAAGAEDAITPAAIGALGAAYDLNDLLGCSFGDPAAVGTALSSVAITAATVYVGRIPLRGTLAVTNVVVSLGGLGATLTNSFAAIFNSSGTILAQSADQSTAWETGGSPGFKTVALTGGPITVAQQNAHDFIWAAIYVGTAGTAPSFGYVAYSTTGLANVGCTTARTRFGSIAQANTSTLASITPGSLAQSNNARWMAIS